MPRGTIKASLVAKGYMRKETSLPTFPSPDKTITVPLQRDVMERKEFATISGVNVYIEEENIIRVDVGGNNLLEGEYIKYSKEKLAQIVVNLDDLKRIWANKDGRGRFKAELVKNGVDLDLLGKLIHTPGTDEFDLVAYFLFDAPLPTRSERAQALLTFKKEMLEKFGSNARDVMIELVDRYRLFGIDEITTPKVFETPPFDNMGYLRGVIDRFGGMDKLKHALEEVEQGIYPDIFKNGVS